MRAHPRYAFSNKGLLLCGCFTASATWYYEDSCDVLSPTECVWRIHRGMAIRVCTFSPLPIRAFENKLSLVLFLTAELWKREEEET